MKRINSLNERDGEPVSGTYGLGSVAVRMGRHDVPFEREVSRRPDAHTPTRTTCARRIRWFIGPTTRTVAALTVNACWLAAVPVGLELFVQVRPAEALMVEAATYLDDRPVAAHHVKHAATTTVKFHCG